MRSDEAMRAMVKVLISGALLALALPVGGAQAQSGRAQPPPAGRPLPTLPAANQLKITKLPTGVYKCVASVPRASQAASGRPSGVTFVMEPRPPIDLRKERYKLDPTTAEITWLGPTLGGTGYVTVGTDGEPTLFVRINKEKWSCKR